MKLLNGKKVSRRHITSIIEIIYLYRLLTLEEIQEIIDVNPNVSASWIRRKILYTKLNKYRSYCPACFTSDSAIALQTNIGLCDSCFIFIISEDQSHISCVSQPTYPNTERMASEIFSKFRKRADFLESKLNELVPTDILAKLEDNVKLTFNNIGEGK